LNAALYGEMLATKRVNRGPLWRHEELYDVISSPGVIGVINEKVNVHVARMEALDVNTDFQSEKLEG
jgi:hypothetical protein